MSYPLIVEGLHERFATVPGLQKSLIYEPTAAHVTPLIYTLLDSFTRTEHGQVTAMRYRILHRLCIKWQDNAQAEETLSSFVNPIPRAVADDRFLGGRIPSGGAEITVGQAGFVRLGGVLYRVLDFFSDVLEKGTDL